MIYDLYMYKIGDICVVVDVASDVVYRVALCVCVSA